MIEHPYIGKLNDKYGADGVVLFTESEFGCPLKREDQMWDDVKLHEYSGDWVNDDFTNITKEYLENKCVKIESPEHSEFVQKLAFKAGYSWLAGKNVALTDKKYLFFNGTQITWFWNNENSTEEIQLPMPPKDSLQEDKGVDEWQPVIGEKALAPSDDKRSVTTVTVAYFGDDDYVLVFDSKKKPMWVCKSLLKPLPKEHVILEEITTFLEDSKGLGTKITATGLVEKFNIEMREK